MSSNQRFVVAALITLACVALAAYAVGRWSLQWEPAGLEAGAAR